MRGPLLRQLTFTGMALVAAAAHAETYTAQIYSVPAGYTKMRVYGAGDNGLMSGFVQGATGPALAAYRTATGHKIMNPQGWYSSRIEDSWGFTYHCGSGYETSSSPTHALFWVGGGAAVDIHPAGSEYFTSVAFGGGGQLQGGYVTGNIPCAECGIDVSQHAGVWSRTAASFRRLHSQTHKQTYAYATDGVKLVGNGTHRVDGSLNALLWNSVTSMSINLRPSMSTQSGATSVWGNQQGGYYKGPSTGNSPHAVIWAGSAGSAIDLNPSPTFVSSEVRAVRNGLQVGYAIPSANPNRAQAIAWHGSAATWINLHSRLPLAFQTWSSTAEGIDQLGNITGSIINSTATDIRPVIWLRS